MMHKDHSENIHRLKTIEGHIRGIQKMLEDGTYCIDVIWQIQAVQSALKKVSTDILDLHLSTCVTTAIKGDDPTERERVIKEIKDLFANSSKT